MAGLELPLATDRPTAGPTFLDSTR
jgi:hypothetical protein